MTFQNLKYIIEIANCHSISQAAKNLYMTQSAVSNAVKETEKEVGIR
ncbi:MAG: LysR family transcriptional regulator, partial [Lachnospiraceae bacterium]|nr:LysR family transcriptional regulator [Lachnospiraceae bacterium]